ncbi:MAG: FtsW/RodA/SpoVE family cell cycle protein [Victivallales bacterium]|nr:FtsW/RodA/SpoVE family cell cycle protein [Victivallales bacterium]
MSTSENTQFLWSRLLFLSAIAILAVYGLFFIYSTGYIGDDYPVRENWQKQCIWLAVGVLCAWFAYRSTPDNYFWGQFVAWGYVGSLIALILVLIFGKSIGGARRWLDFGGLLLQPAEFAKYFTLLLVAKVLSMDGNRWRTLAWTGFLAALPLLLIVIEPSYGNALSLLPPVAMLVLVRYAPQRVFHWLLAVGTALVLLFTATLTWLRSPHGRNLVEHYLQNSTESSTFLRPYHVRRIRNYLDPRGDWNERQSVIAIASGGPSGKGYLQGNMKSLGFLPRTVAPTDFIFSVIAEEMGFLFGTLPILCLYGVLLLLALFWGSVAPTRMGELTCVGMATLLFTHVAVNIGMTVRLLPVIGLPLPLLSYGGSYTIMTLLALGTILAIPAHADAPADVRPSSTHVLNLGKLLRIQIRNE